MYLTEVSRTLRGAAAVTEFPNVERLNELMIVGPITCAARARTTCARSSQGVDRRDAERVSNLIGLSKYVRLADWVMSRPQIQEEAVTHLADLLQDACSPTGSRS